MPNTILLDPSAGTPAVISVGGVCYQLSGPSSAEPDTDDFDNSYSDCASCATACVCTVTQYTVSFTNSASGTSPTIVYQFAPNDCNWGNQNQPGPGLISVRISCNNSNPCDFSVSFGDGYGGDYGNSTIVASTPVGTYPDAYGANGTTTGISVSA